MIVGGADEDVPALMGTFSASSEETYSAPLILQCLMVLMVMPLWQDTHLEKSEMTWR